MKKYATSGSLDLKYANERATKKSTTYRLWRRTVEVISALETFAPQPIEDIIDLGTADGRMLNSIKGQYPASRCIGIEFNQELANFGRSHFSEIDILQGDIQVLDFSDKSFDAALLIAVIEHVPDPEKVVREVYRVLKPGGVLVLTSPDPFWEYVATKVGHLQEGQHHRVMNISQLSDLFKQNGFSVLKTKKFMLSPVGMPFEFVVEKWIRKLNLNFILANQLIVGRR